MRHELMTQPFVSTCCLLDSLPSSESAQGSLKTKTQLSPGRLLKGYVRLQLFPNTWVMPNCLRLVLWWSWKIFLLVLLDRKFQSPSLSHGPKANHPLPSVVEARTSKVLKGVEKFSLEISRHKLSPLKYLILFSIDLFSSVTPSCPTLCNPIDYSTSVFPVHHQLPKPTQTHIHSSGDAILTFHPPSSPSPPTFNLSQDQGLLI